MKIRTFAIAAGTLALGLAAWNTPGKAQGPLYDRVNVNLPYSVSIGDKTLQPGEYVIQQLSGIASTSRVLLIYSDSGMKFETSAMTIPALDQSTPEDTKIVLHHFGSDYYFDKIWIQGKNYGYEFPLPDSVKARERERLQPISVAANYSTVPAENNATTTETTASAATSTQTESQATDQATNQATNSQATDSQTTNSQATDRQRTTSQTATSPSITGQAESGESTMMAQNTPPVTTAPQTASSATTAPQTAGSQDFSGSADRSMPETSAGWLMMLLGGVALSAAGVVIRRKR